MVSGYMHDTHTGLCPSVVPSSIQCYRRVNAANNPLYTGSTWVHEQELDLLTCASEPTLGRMQVHALETQLEGEGRGGHAHLATVVIVPLH